MSDLKPPSCWILLAILLVPGTSGLNQAGAQDQPAPTRAQAVCRRAGNSQLPGVRRSWPPGLRHRPRPPSDQAHSHRRTRRQGSAQQRQGHLRQRRTGRVYISTHEQLMCLDLASEKVLWEKRYEGGCDRMSITPDGQYDLPAIVRGWILERGPGRGWRDRHQARAQLGLAQHAHRRQGRRGLPRGPEITLSHGRRAPRPTKFSATSARSRRASGHSP